MKQPLGSIGPKAVARGKHAVASSQHPIVTETVLRVMKAGGNAIDAAIAGCLVQATVQQDMTNHTGTVTLLYYEAKTGRAYQLNSMGTVVPDMPLFRPVSLPVPEVWGGVSLPPSFACIPGFMPGMKAMHERFGTQPWASLCESAIHWAEEGEVVNSFEYMLLNYFFDRFRQSQSGREHFTPNGFLPQVGEHFPKPALARTLRRLSDEGPDYFITGGWAHHFVERANEMGWAIKLEHMNQVPPRWQEPLRFRHKGYEVVQLAPPERQGVYCALVLGILDHFDLQSMGHYSQSAESLYTMAHALRWAGWQTGFLNDPQIFDVPTESWLSEDASRLAAQIIHGSRPKIDLTNHVRLAFGPNAMPAAGLFPKAPQPQAGSCELSVVDAEGNWVQMMNTLQSGGIPGEVVDGVCMLGSDGVTHMGSPIGGWLTGGGRMRSCIGNTIVLKNGKPMYSLGTPGNVYCTVPQVLASILDWGMDPPDAVSVPRMLPVGEDYTLDIESRIPTSVVAGMAKLGILIKPHEKYDYHMGSFQCSWRDEKTGLLNSCTDPRRAGNADGF